MTIDTSCDEDQNKCFTMPLNADISTALKLLEHIQQTIDSSDDVKLQMQTSDDLNLLISVLENPILRSILTVQDSLSELKQQLQDHPSILPVDFEILPAGDLVLNVQKSLDLYYLHHDSQELEDQRVPQLSHSSSGDTGSPPQVHLSHSTEVSQPPITTQTYAIEFQKTIEESSHGRQVLTVQLFKPENTSLGFSVVGLRSEEHGELGIFVQEIQPSGIAGRDGRIHEGDQILAIDGQPLDSNISHQQAINILQKARGLVDLVLARTDEAASPTVHSASPIPSPTRSPSAVSDTSKAGSDMVLNTEWAQVEVIDLVNDGSGLGFGIIGGRSTGVVVKTILLGGVADRDGRLLSGDHILQIGDVNLRAMGSEQVAAVLRQSGSHVRLIVARPVEPTSPDYQPSRQAPVVPTKILGDPEELERHLNQVALLDPYDDGRFIFREEGGDVELRSTLPILATPSLPTLTMDMIPAETPLPEMETFVVELMKDVHGLGITIAGYVCEKEELSGIFVKSISSGSAADLCGKIQVNDRIVEVDGQSLQGYTNHQAVNVLRNTRQTVRLCLERYLRGPKFEQLQQAIANSELRPPITPAPASPSAASLPRFPISADGESNVEVEAEGESHTTVDSLLIEGAEALNPDVALDDVDLLIDDDYSGPLLPSVEAAIQAKWSKIMGPENEIVVAQLRKFEEGGGLGISLEGTVDVEDGLEVRPHHYIRSILPGGPVGTNRLLESGDELLEVNGRRLLGMNHVEVVTILKEVPMCVRIVCARRVGDMPYRLIDTSQDRAAFATRSLLGGSLQNLIPATERLVKAKSDGSLASTTTSATATDASFSKMKSRSLEPLTGLAMWSSEPHIIELTKGERGLGFSILDYQDPMNPSETVIVIRSLVPGGVAQLDGRLIPGDRLLFVNNTNLENASLDQAVQALKGAPKGAVQIGVAKPLPIPDSVSQSASHVQDLSSDSPTLDDQSEFSSAESLPTAEGELDAPPDLTVNLTDNPETPATPGSAATLDQHDDAAFLDEPDLVSSPAPPLAVLSDDAAEASSSSAAAFFSPEAPSPTESPSPSVPLTGVPPPPLPPTPLLPTPPPPPPPPPMPPFWDIGASTAERLSRISESENVDPELLQMMVPVSTERLLPAPVRTPSLGGDLTDEELEDEEIAGVWAADVIQLPAILELSIRLRKGSDQLGLSVDSIGRSVNGMLVLAVAPGGALYRDGRIVPGDFLVAVNNENLRNVTNSQARAILRRAQLLSTDISVTYIPGEAAAAYKKSLINAPPSTPPQPKPSSQKSPRSPFISQDESGGNRSRTVSGSESIPEEDKVFVEEERISPPPRPEASISPLRIQQEPEPVVPEPPVQTAPTPPKDLPISTLELSSVESLTDEVVAAFSSKTDLISSGSPPAEHLSLKKSELPSVGSSPVERSPVHTLCVREFPSVGTSPSPVPRSEQVIRRASSASESGTVTLAPPDNVRSRSRGSVRRVNSQCDSTESRLSSEKRSASVSPVPRVCISPATMTVVQPDSSEDTAVLLAQYWGPERLVRVYREPDSSLGISIVGGKVDLYNTGPDSKSAISGIFIKNVLPQSPAGRTAELRTGDRILEVDGVDLRAASHERAVQVIRAAGDPVSFLVQSFVQWSGPTEVESDATSRSCTDAARTSVGGSIRRSSTTSAIPKPPLRSSVHSPASTPSPTDKHQENHVTEVLGSGQSRRTSATLAPPSVTAKPSITKSKTEPDSSDEDSEDDEDTRDLEGRVYTKKGKEISRASAGNMKRTKEEIENDPEEEDDYGYTTNKIRKRYTAATNSGASVLLVAVERPTVSAGLGISLAGHKDRNKMAVLVCGVRPSGAAARLGPDAVCVGDEILEVNGVVLQGRSHHNASAIIKGMAGPVLKIVLLRKVAGLEELAVKPITQFPVSLDDQTPEERYSNFKNLKTFVIKKPGCVDASVGGVLPFAPQAGLAVGDMVLAVNGDSLVGASYDKAAGILKKTEGLTTLHVSSPHDTKKEDKEEKSGDGKPLAAKSPTAPAPAPEKPRSRDASPLPHNDLNGQTEVSPAQAVIEVGKETTIEISRENVPLGLGIVGGEDTPLKAIVVHEIYPAGAAAKDNRLRVGDQILEVGSENLRAATHSKAIATLRQAPTKVKMVVYREESTENEADILELMDIELTKKSGKGLGLSILGKKSGKGVFVSDILQGGAAEADGRLLRGDHILEVNNQDLRGATLEEAAVVLKTTSGKVALKIGRIKAKTKCDESLPTELATDEAAEPKPQDSPSINSKSPPIIRSPKRRNSVRKILTRLSFRRRKQSSSPLSPSPSASPF